jgi:hypothetical protein
VSQKKRRHSAGTNCRDPCDTAAGVRDGTGEDAGPDLALLTHGFYIDTDSAVSVGGFLKGSLTADLVPGLLSGGVSGFIIAAVGITTHDEPGSTDGQARLFAEPLKPLFTLDGSIFGGPDFVFEAGPWPFEVETGIHLGDGTSLQLGYDVNNPFSPPADLALADAGTAANSIGNGHFVVPGGVLALNVGARAVNRNVEEAEINEAFTVSPVEPGTVKVTAFGYSQLFHGVTEIKAAAGTGRDLLIGGFGANYLSGGADEDILVGGRTGSDASDVGLYSIMAQWAGAGTYDDRVSALLGSPLFVWFDDGAADQLAGGDGLDWFWGGMDGNDTTTVNNVAEVVS